MQIIDLDDFDSVNTILTHIQNGPIVLELPTVFSIVCLPTSESIEQMNQIKARRAGKNYGSLIGNLEPFYNLLQKEIRSGEFSNLTDLYKLNGTFIRGKITHDSFNSETVRNGTHQGLLLTGPIQHLCASIEENFQSIADPELYDNKQYSAPICTSANLSGDPSGSITELKDALEFAKNRGVELVVTIKEGLKSKHKGSYPIVWLKENEFTIERNGPGLDQLNLSSNRKN